MIRALLLVLVVLTSCKTSGQVSDAEKSAFLALLGTLPHKGEFYTEDAVKKAGPHLRVLFALTETDIDRYDLYPFAGISRGLADHEEHREYAVRHFSEIRHPTLKVLWGAILFDAAQASAEIVRFLRAVLESEPQTKLLNEIVGLEFEDFRRRVLAH